MKSQKSYFVIFETVLKQFTISLTYSPKQAKSLQELQEHQMIQTLPPYIARCRTARLQLCIKY